MRWGQFEPFIWLKEDLTHSFISILIYGLTDVTSLALSIKPKTIEYTKT